MTDYIRRADAINAFWEDSDIRTAEVRATLKALPSADAVSRDVYDKRTQADEEIIDSYRKEFQKALSDDAVQGEEYTETDGVVTIEKQRANEVGKVKHIVVHSPNYTRYFYNESMPIPSELPKTTDCTDFLYWLIDEVMDEENWELNAVADGEIIARKLKKLGLLESENGYYHDISRATEESLRNAYYDGFNTASIEAQNVLADSVKVVRCKDCRWWQDNNGGYPHANCRWCETETPDADDYCSGGELAEQTDELLTHEQAWADIDGRPHGEWIGDKWHHCSVCGQPPIAYEVGGYEVEELTDGVQCQRGYRENRGTGRKGPQTESRKHEPKDSRKDFGGGQKK